MKDIDLEVDGRWSMVELNIHIIDKYDGTVTNLHI